MLRPVPSGQPASSPSDVAVLVNPTSGRGRGARYGLRAVRTLRELGVGARVLVGRDENESRDLARQAAGSDVDALVVVGGDGLVNLALQVVAETSLPMGVVAAGSGDDLARSLGLPRRSPERAAAAIAAGHTRSIDLARTQGRYFATVLASGFDSFVNERANQMAWPRGPMRYNVAVAAELRGFRPLPFTLELDDATRRVEAMLVAVGNGPTYGGGLRITEGATIDDGRLDVAVIKPVSRLELVKVYPRLYTGTLPTHPQYEHHRVRRVTLAAPGVSAYADGERLGMLPLSVECVPAALTVYVGVQ
jgi:diacylglycerol kinase (ATP)